MILEPADPQKTMDMLLALYKTLEGEQVAHFAEGLDRERRGELIDALDDANAYEDRAEEDDAS